MDLYHKVITDHVVIITVLIATRLLISFVVTIIFVLFNKNAGCVLCCIMHQWILITLLIHCIKANGLPMKNPYSNDFGPYDVQWREIKKCTGPKKTDLTIQDMKLIQSNGTHDILYFNTTYFNDTIMEEVKVTVYNNNPHNRVILWNYAIKEPCKHFTFSTLFSDHLKTKNCLIKKGNYSFVVNVSETTKKFFGNSFFYGEYAFKIVILSKKGNILCITMTAKFMKSSR